MRPIQPGKLLHRGCVSAVLLLGLCGERTFGQFVPSIVWTKTTHADFIAPVALSPDGNVVASAGPSGSVRLSRLVDGVMVKDLIGHTDPVDAVAFSPDGAMLASCAEDRTLRLWDIASGAQLKVIPLGNGNRQFLPVAFHPGGQYVASDRFRTNVALWRVEDGTLAWEALGNRGEVESIAFSPDGTIVASAGGYRNADVSIRIRRVSDGVLLQTLVTSNAYGVRQLAFSPDGKWLAAGTDRLENFPGAVEVWHTANWTRSAQLNVHAPVLAFSPDSRLLLTLQERTLSFWRMPQARRLGMLSLPANEPAFSPHSSLAISPDARWIVTGRYRFISTVNGTVPEGIASALRFPVILDLTRNSSELRLQWSGGYPGYQVQRRPIGSASWQNFGPVTTNQSLTLPLDQSGELFRVTAP